MIGQTLGPYRIVEKLGEGGMGVVYRAHDSRLDRFVAIKVLSPRLAAAPAALERFHREARAIAALNHPNICAIHDVGANADGPAFIAMELVEGVPLDRRLAFGPLDVGELVEIGAALADALDAAHARSILHRDIKPSNIVLSRRGPKMLDFGLASVAVHQPGDASLEMTRPLPTVLTSPGDTVGTLAYMSPEQLRGEVLDVRSDVFSLGLVLYEMATGRPAFTGTTTALISSAILHDEPAAPRELRNDLPPRLEEIILKTIEKDRSLRCQTASELRADLKRFARASGGGVARAVPPLVQTTGTDASHARRGESPSSGEPPGRARVGSPPLRRWVTIAAGLVLLVGAVAAAALWGPGGASEPAVTSAADASVVVLPFDDISPGGDQQSFADGLTQELIGTLAQRGLRPVGRESSFAFRDRIEDRQAIADTLGVRYILNGGVGRDGDRLRVNVSLTDVGTGLVRWTKKYDEPRSDIFAVQDEIATSVAQALEVTLGLGRSGRPGFTRNAAAYEEFLQGLPLVGRFTEEATMEAVEHLRKALRLDPEFANAHLALRLFYLQRAALVPGRSEELQRAAAEALEHAERLAPDSLGVLFVLAEEHARQGRWLDAGSFFERAVAQIAAQGITIVDGPPPSRFLVAAGRAADAVEPLLRAREENPLEVQRSVFLADAYEMIGRHDEALDVIDRITRLRGSQRNGEILLQGSGLLAALGQGDRAEIDRRLAMASAPQMGNNHRLAAFLDRRQEAAAEIRRLSGLRENQTSVASWVFANWAAYYGDPALALELIDKSAELNNDPFMIVPWRSVMRDVWKLPAFKEYVRRRGYVEYWRKYGWSHVCRPVGEDYVCGQ